jgi:hypothetical protein
MAMRHTGGTLERPAYNVGYLDLGDGWQADLSRWVPTWTRCAVPCRAHRSNGLPCAAWAVRGATVCVAHGGAAPQVRRAARRRLAVADWERSASRALRSLGAWP